LLPPASIRSYQTLPKNLQPYALPFGTFLLCVLFGGEVGEAVLLRLQLATRAWPLPLKTHQPRRSLSSSFSPWHSNPPCRRGTGVPKRQAAWCLPLERRSPDLSVPQRTAAAAASSDGTNKGEAVAIEGPREPREQSLPRPKRAAVAQAPATASAVLQSPRPFANRPPFNVVGLVWPFVLMPLPLPWWQLTLRLPRVLLWSGMSAWTKTRTTW
jgi:hypothetical protein